MEVRRNGLSLAILLLCGCFAAGCGISPTEDGGYIDAQKRLNAARADSRVREFAAAPLADAERTLESARDAVDLRELRHFVYLTDKKIDIAHAVAERRRLEEELESLRNKAESEAERARLAREIELERKRAAEREAQERAAEQSRLSEFQARNTPRGTVLTLSDVLFDSNKAELSPGAERSLETLVNYLRENPERRIVVEGYTDNSGTPEGNLKLSLARAEAVKSFLVQHGIDAGRISTLGHGQNYPVVSNDTMAGRQRNRRVEILIERAESAPPRGAEDRQSSGPPADGINPAGEPSPQDPRSRPAG